MEELMGLKLHSNMQSSKKELHYAHAKYMNNELSREDYLEQVSWTHYETIAYLSHALDKARELIDLLEEEGNGTK